MGDFKNKCYCILNWIILISVYLFIGIIVLICISWPIIKVIAVLKYLFS